MREQSKARQRESRALKKKFISAWLKITDKQRDMLMQTMFGASHEYLYEGPVRWTIPFEVMDMVFHVNMSHHTTVELKDDWLYRAEFPDWLEEKTHKAWTYVLETLLTKCRTSTISEDIYLLWSEPTMLNMLGWMPESNNDSPTYGNIEALAFLSQASTLPSLAKDWPTIGPWLQIAQSLSPIPKESDALKQAWWRQARSMCQSAPSDMMPFSLISVQP